ncbi:MAG: hypothetical protein ACI8TX_002441 [Hyphomicrobiaceae bacterium]|jgi:hypothetical protein
MKQLVMGLACVMLAASCQSGDSGPKTKPPRIDEARVTSAKIGGRDLRMYTFSARIDDKSNEIVAARVVYATGAEPFTKSADGVTLNDPDTREAKYEAAQRQILYISASDKNNELETYFDSAEDTQTAFYFEIDYKAPDMEETFTEQTGVFHIDLKNIDRNNLASDVKN